MFVRFQTFNRTEMLVLSANSLVWITDVSRLGWISSLFHWSHRFMLRPSCLRFFTRFADDCLILISMISSVLESRKCLLSINRFKDDPWWISRTKYSDHRIHCFTYSMICGSWSINFILAPWCWFSFPIDQLQILDCPVTWWLLDVQISRLSTLPLILKMIFLLHHVGIFELFTLPLFQVTLIDQ